METLTLWKQRTVWCKSQCPHFKEVLRANIRQTVAKILGKGVLIKCTAAFCVPIETKTVNTWSHTNGHNSVFVRLTKWSNTISWVELSSSIRVCHLHIWDPRPSFQSEGASRQEQKCASITAWATATRTSEETGHLCAPSWHWWLVCSCPDSLLPFLKNESHLHPPQA